MDSVMSSSATTTWPPMPGCTWPPVKMAPGSSSGAIGDVPPAAEGRTAALRLTCEGGSSSSSRDEGAATSRAARALAGSSRNRKQGAYCICA